MAVNLYELKEIQKFAGLAKDWWQQQGAMQPLHAINIPRCLFIDTQISLADKKLLDIGCGGGIFAEAMAERGAKVTGIDPSAELIQAAQQHAETKKLNINYRTGSADWWLENSKRKQYDIVSCLEVLEHTDRPAELIKQCAAFLPKGGWGYFSTINKTIKAYLLAIVGAEYLLSWLPKGTHSYDHFIQPAQLNEWLEAAGLVTKHIRGMTYDPISNQFELSRSVSVNYLLLAQKP